MYLKHADGESEKATRIKESNESDRRTVKRDVKYPIDREAGSRSHGSTSVVSQCIQP